MIFTTLTQIVPSIVLHALPLFRIARDPTTAAALADPYLGQSIGPVPGYGVSFVIYRFFLPAGKNFCSCPQVSQHLC